MLTDFGSYLRQKQAFSSKVCFLEAVTLVALGGVEIIWPKSFHLIKHLLKPIGMLPDHWRKCFDVYEVIFMPALCSRLQGLSGRMLKAPCAEQLP